MQRVIKHIFILVYIPYLPLLCTDTGVPIASFPGGLLLCITDLIRDSKSHMRSRKWSGRWNKATEVID